MEKIILSGGWGYGNMGDDAILLASINLLQDKFPQCQITVLTADAIETQKVLHNKKEITIRQDLYKEFFGNLYAVQPQSTLVLRKLKDTVANRIGYTSYKKKILAKNYLKDKNRIIGSKKEAIQQLCEVFGSHDMYVMSGGGYLNTWIEMAIIKHIESTLAKENFLKTFAIGQTVGPFNEVRYAKVLFNKILGLMDGSFFRDDESVKECNSVSKILDHKIPDVALYDVLSKGENRNILVFIPFIGGSGQKNIIDKLSVDFKKIQKERGTKIVVAITQSWIYSIQLAANYYLYFRQHSIDAELIIPNDVFELQKLLGSSICVVSQNLHGLILAYRNQVPVISLNVKRKFIGFMKEINAEDLLLNPSTLTQGQLFDAFLKSQQMQFDKQELLRQKIIHSFEWLMAK